MSNHNSSLFFKHFKTVIWLVTENANGKLRDRFARDKNYKVRSHDGNGGGADEEADTAGARTQDIPNFLFVISGIFMYLKLY